MGPGRLIIVRVAPASVAMTLIFVLVLAESTEFLAFGLLPNLSLD